MPKLQRVLVRIAVFAAVFLPSLTPSWWLMEKLWTRDTSSEKELQPRLFAVLVRQPDRANRYAVDFYPDLEPESRLVTDFSDQDIATINRDLRASISAETSKYVYFTVLRRGQGYVDVLLEAPTRGDFWRKNSYRIQDGEIHPQRIIFFGPGFGLIVAIPPAVVGIIAVLGCDALISRRQKKVDPNPTR